MTGSVFDLVVTLVKGALPANQLTDGFRAVAPLLAELAQSEAVLTDDLRSKIQGQVLSLLRKAGLSGEDLL